MGWGDPRGPSRADVLATAVREWNKSRTLANEERMVKALESYDSEYPASPAAY